MKFFGSSAVDMSGTILQAPRRLIGRVVAPAVLVALPVAGARHVGELVGERALRVVSATRAEAVGVAGGGGGGARGGGGGGPPRPPSRSSTGASVAASTARKRISSGAEGSSASPSA